MTVTKTDSATATAVAKSFLSDLSGEKYQGIDCYAVLFSDGRKEEAVDDGSSKLPEGFAEAPTVSVTELEFRFQVMAIEAGAAG